MIADEIRAGSNRPIDESAAVLPAWLDEAADITGVLARSLSSLRSKAEERAFNRVVAAEVKRGKSSLVNALLGAEVLPTAVVPLMSVVTVLRHAESPSVDITFDDGTPRPSTLAALADYVTERGNPDNVKGVREVTVGYPGPWLAGGVRLVDTPGIGSVHEHNSEVTRRFLPEADAVIFVAAVDQPLSRNELDFLVDIRRHADKVFCLLDKIDLLSDVEVAESLAFVTQVVHQALGDSVLVYPLSARPALQGRLAKAADVVLRSRLPAFNAALRRFLVAERGDAWVDSVRKHFLRLLDDSCFSIELEVSALAAPIDVLDSRLEAFAAKQAKTLEARSDIEALLEAGSRKLVKDRLEPDLDAFGSSLRARLDTLLSTWYSELRPLGSTALQAGLEERLSTEVRQTFDAWRLDEDVAISKAFDQMCNRFHRDLEASVDDLMRDAAELFCVPFVAGPRESLWRSRSNFRYKFWSEPPSLVLLNRSAVLALPGFLGHPSSCVMPDAAPAIWWTFRPGGRGSTSSSESRRTSTTFGTKC